MKVQQSLRLAHTSSILISVAVNALLVAALLMLITFTDGQDRDTSTVLVIDPADQEQIEEIVPEIEPEEPVDPEELDQLLEDFTMDVDVNTDFEQETETTEPIEQDVSNLSDLMSDVPSPVVMSGLLMGRSASGRSQALKQYGQGLGGVTEPAVLKALRWLQANQHPSGAWGDEGKRGDPGHTGLALLAFLAHGETPSSREFGGTVAKGIRFLVENQDSKGLFQPAGRHVVYSQAMATYALAETLTLTQNILLRQPLERAVRVMMENQHPTGGFEYKYEVKDTHDVSADAWHVQALKAASIALPENGEIKKSMMLTMDGMLLGSLDHDQGRGFGYRLGVESSPKPSDFREILTAAGLLGMYLTGRGDQSEAREILDYLDRHTEKDQLPEWGLSRIGSDEYGGELMFWYYAVQAFFQEDRDGSNFKRFYPAMVKALVRNQAEDGHWKNFSRESPEQGLTLDTSLSALGLMVTYRYLPTTQATPISERPAARDPDEDGEVDFEI